VTHLTRRSRPPSCGCRNRVQRRWRPIELAPFSSPFALVLPSCMLRMYERIYQSIYLSKLRVWGNGLVLSYVGEWWGGIRQTA
jgi:hypothetical protein